MDLKAEKAAAYDLADRIANLSPWPPEVAALTEIRDALRFAAHVADKKIAVMREIDVAA